MKKLKVEGHENLVRDTKNNAILNTDKTGLQEYKIRKELARKKDMRVAKLENEVSQIKSLLQELIKEGKK